MLSYYRLVLSFLTIIPVGRVGTPTPEMMGRLPGYYPLAGLTVGLACCAAYWLLCLIGAPAGAAPVLLVTILMILTRGFHLDGLADAADALLSHRSLERKLEILKDSHLGTFGVAAIILDVLLKAALLQSIAQNDRLWAALALYPVWGRLSASAVAVWGRNARDVPGLGYHMVQGGRGSDLLLAIITAAVASIFAGASGLWTALAALILGRFLVWVWRKALGGVTGDLLGASVELGELFSLMVFAILIA